MSLATESFFFGIVNKKVCGQLPPWRLLLASIVMSVVTYFPVGFHHCVMNVAHDVFREMVNESYAQRYDSGGDGLATDQLEPLWSTIVSSWQIGAVVGSFNAFWIADKFGRIFTLSLITGACQLTASILLILALEIKYFELLIVGRFLAGVGTGVVCIVLRVFVGECAPDRYRGTLNSVAGFILSVAVVFALVLGLPEALGEGTVIKSQILLGFCLPFNIGQIAAFPFIPETPKFLYLSRRDKKKAEASIVCYHGPEADANEIFQEFEEEKKLAGEQLSFCQALRMKSVRLPLILSAVAGVCDCSAGTDVADNYSAIIFTKLGLPLWEGKLCSILMNVASMIGAGASMVLIDRCRRRTLLLSTLLVCFAANVAVVIIGGVAKFAYDEKPPGVGFGATTAVLFSVTQFAYGLGPGATLEPLFAEVSPHRVRTVAGSISEVSNTAVKWVYVFMQPITANYVGAMSFLTHTIPLGLCIVYLYYYLPETGKQSVAHIVQAMVSRKSGSRKSTKKIIEKVAVRTEEQAKEAEEKNERVA